MNKDEGEGEGDLLEHRVDPEFVEYGGVGDPEQSVDNVNNPVGGGYVGGNDGSVYAAPFHGDGLVSPRALHHVEVELLPVGGGRYLQEFVRKLCEGMLATWRRVTRVNHRGHVRCFQRITLHVETAAQMQPEDKREDELLNKKNA